MTISDDLYHEIGILARVMGISKVTVIRHAVSYFRLHVEAASKGDSVVVESKGSETKRFIAFDLPLKEPYRIELELPEEIVESELVKEPSLLSKIFALIGL